MVKTRQSKVAYGVIVRSLDDPTHIERFLTNAEAHHHPIDRVIVAASHGFNTRTVDVLRRRTELTLVDAYRDEELSDRLQNSGMLLEDIDHLLDYPHWSHAGEVPYGAYRNAVLVDAVLEGMDYLLFFDSDVQPRVLTALTDGQCLWQEVDFVGAHLDTLASSEVHVTTSDYSGYYIIPPLQFEGLSDLLFGLGKGMVLEYMEDCVSHACLNLGPEHRSDPIPTDKPLGGNLGLSLDRIGELAPFFSVLYDYNGLWVKGRGEDTLLGQALRYLEGAMLDIDLRLFHETYVDFPLVPDIRRAPIRDRFYRACLGWIGRNPFMTWFRDQAGALETSFAEEIERQRTGLRCGGKQAAVALGDARLARLSEAFEAAYAQLPDAIDQYQRLISGWRAFLDVVTTTSGTGNVVDGGGARSFVSQHR